MPFVSQQQRRYMYLKHPDIAARWEKETSKDRLPRKKKRVKAIPPGKNNGRK